MDQQTKVSPISTLQPGDWLKTIEAVVYRRWIAKRPNTQNPNGYSCILLDTYGNAIQDNTNYKDKDHFERMLQPSIQNFKLHMQTRKKMGRNYLNSTSLIFELQTEFESIPAKGYLQHYFEFESFNQVKAYSITDT
ncbi:uncharacterized protein [Rutidosis leptorrhynchoides]|uniref:uncharacterized protein n=1 Tax=Rutidosis leptorrhynchoides TaxID=125765 RepID=UPI003A996B79